MVTGERFGIRINRVLHDVIAQILIHKSDLLNFGNGRTESATGKESEGCDPKQDRGVRQFYQFQFNWTQVPPPRRVCGIIASGRCFRDHEKLALSAPMLLPSWLWHWRGLGWARALAPNFHFLPFRERKGRDGMSDGKNPKSSTSWFEFPSST